MTRTISIDALTDRYGPLREKYGNAYGCAIDKGTVSIIRHFPDMKDMEGWQQSR